MASCKIVELNESNTCKICNNAIGKYSCPRCNLLYCSLSCYQAPMHLECSESFYKDCILQNLDENGDDAQKKMAEILNRFHEQNKLAAGSSDENVSDEAEYVTDSDDDDAEIYADIGERLAGIDLDNTEDVWEKLNEDERREFESFLMSGDVSKFITRWTPWWEFNSSNRIIEVSVLEEHKAKCPEVADNIAQLSELSSKPPATCVGHNMSNVIAAYAFTVRYFNGDHYDFPKETASYIHNLSLNLKSNQNFDTFNQAVHSVSMDCINNELGIVADQENVDYIKTDVQMIFTGPHATDRNLYVLCALSDMQRIFLEALKQRTQNEDGTFFKKFTEKFPATHLIAKDDVKKCLRKIEYFLAYAKYAEI